MLFTTVFFIFYPVYYFTISESSEIVLHPYKIISKKNYFNRLAKAQEIIKFVFQSLKIKTYHAYKSLQIK